MTHLYLTKAPVHALLGREEAAGSARGWDVDSPTFRHRAVMGLFGELEGRASAGILFRLDRVAGQAPYFLVQSKIAPEIPEELTGIEVREVELPQLAQGQTVSLRVAVNAVRRKTEEVDGKKKTRVTPVPFDFDEQVTEKNEETVSPWLARKLSPALRELEVVNHVRDVLKDPPARGGSKTLLVDIIDAIAVVGENEALARLLREGVGREKAYGCGLLSVRGLQ
ncbi:type I-E CRISPR-associated protein Cas6/Cse3/CasE [Corynebacterium atypicum]|uniref:type I-E CRISPR-associated protein Cas6/Cse3/CasE n=1 Tax=Corynebacterium atypicum TaxID=191610 RepID=UPI00068D5AF6|nr:type I-E CRISPR-associated protein Cas6/Cse3/CasE [Corynebacterium atypicum]